MKVCVLDLRKSRGTAVCIDTRPSEEASVHANGLESLVLCYVQTGGILRAQLFPRLSDQGRTVNYLGNRHTLEIDSGVDKIHIHT